MRSNLRYDKILADATIYDGTGRVPFHSDLGVIGDRIAALGDLSEAETADRISLSGLALCPGFIDVHDHVDFSAAHENQHELLEPMLRQGVTTAVGGNCGVSLAPIGEENREIQMAFYDFFIGQSQEDRIHWTTMNGFFEHLEDIGLVLNLGVLAPHGMLRMIAMGNRIALADRPAMERMKRDLEACLDAGCLGLSTGLQYFPGSASDTPELVELARLVRKYNGVFTSHLRSYNSNTIMQAVEEVLAVGREAEVRAQISHLFWAPNFGDRINPIFSRVVRGASWLYNKRPFPVPIDAATRPILDHVAGLIDEGMPVGIDAMPTAAGFTHMLAFFPPWSLEGQREDITERIRNPSTRAEIRRSIETGQAVWPHRDKDTWSMNLFKILGWGGVYIMSVVSEQNQHLIGKSMTAIGKEQGKHPFDAACDLLLEEEGRVLVFETATYPGDPFVELSLIPSLVDPNVSVVTDAILFGFGLPSHLFFDCYPKFLGLYVRDKGRLPLREAIRKCTSLPASQLQIKQRGRIEEGCFADLVAFDPARIRTRSTAMDPKHWPAGIEYVLVNGSVVVDPDGYHPDPRPGRLLRGG